MSDEEDAILRQIVELDILLEIRRRKQAAAKALQRSVDDISEEIFRFNEIPKGLRHRPK